MTPGPIASTTDLAAYSTGDPQKALDVATEEVRSQCGWHIAPALTETLELTGRGTPTLFLPSLHVTAVTAVRVDGVTLSPAEYTWTTAGSLTRTTGWWASGSVVEVDLTHGHDPVPADVAGTVMALATRRITDPKGNLLSVTRGPFAESYRPGNEPALHQTVARYRIPRSR